MHSRIKGTGSYLPAKILTNHELASRIDTSDAWVRARTGISERRIAAPTETTSDLALNAARAALDAAGIAPSDVDLIVVATTTPDIVFPSTACILQAKLGAHGGQPGPAGHVRRRRARRPRPGLRRARLRYGRAEARHQTLRRGRR